MAKPLGPRPQVPAEVSVDGTDQSKSKMKSKIKKRIKSKSKSKRRT
jgi:hypothetical protein